MRPMRVVPRRILRIVVFPCFSLIAHATKSKPPGAARQLVTFLVLPKKVTQRRRPQCTRACGVPSIAQKQAGLRNSTSRLRRSGFEQCSPKPPLASALSRRAHRGWGGTPSALQNNSELNCWPPLTPYPPPSSAGGSWDVWHVCSSTWPRNGSCEFMSQPDLPSNAGNSNGMADRGGVSLPTLAPT